MTLGGRAPPPDLRAPAGDQPIAFGIAPFTSNAALAERSLYFFAQRASACWSAWIA